MTTVVRIQLGIRRALTLAELIAQLRVLMPGIQSDGPLDWLTVEVCGDE